MPLRHKNRMGVDVLLLVAGLFLLPALLGCQAPSAAGSAAVTSADDEPAFFQPVVTTPAPVVIDTATAPATLPAFAPVNAEQLAAAKATQQAAIEPTAPPIATPSPLPEEDEPPPPTFTPPALPFTSPWEHYWLRRPIPEGGVVWTDKVYPYGGTRGGSLRPHHGVEFYVPSGTQVLAAASGVVRVAGDDSVITYGPDTNFYGKLVIIELDARLDGRPVYILYAHLSLILVMEGQQVAALEPIAFSGASGVADGPHLHFEVRVGQNSYNHTRNPVLWLYPFPDYGIVAGRVTWPNGELAQEAPVSLRRIDAPSRYLATTTYAGNSVNPDDNWDENFALDDVPAGYYELTVAADSKRYKQEFWVFPYQTTFVEIVLDNN